MPIGTRGGPLCGGGCTHETPKDLSQEKQNGIKAILLKEFLPDDSMTPTNQQAVVIVKLSDDVFGVLKAMKEAGLSSNYSPQYEIPLILGEGISISVESGPVFDPSDPIGP